MTEQPEPANVGRAGLRGADIGVHLVVCVLLGAGLGWGLDRLLGWQPWGMVAGCFMGFGAWMTTIMRMRP